MLRFTAMTALFVAAACARTRADEMPTLEETLQYLQAKIPCTFQLNGEAKGKTATCLTTNKVTVGKNGVMQVEIQAEVTSTTPATKSENEQKIFTQLVIRYDLTLKNLDPGTVKVARINKRGDFSLNNPVYEVSISTTDNVKTISVASAMAGVIGAKLNPKKAEPVSTVTITFSDEKVAKGVMRAFKHGIELAGGKTSRTGIFDKD